jgi:hypothetical protein
MQTGCEGVFLAGGQLVTVFDLVSLSLFKTNFQPRFSRPKQGKRPPKWARKLVRAAGKTPCFGWPADSEFETPSGDALTPVAAWHHAVHALIYDLAMGRDGYLHRWGAWIRPSRSPPSPTSLCIFGTHHALPQAAVHAILLPHARTVSHIYR